MHLPRVLPCLLKGLLACLCAWLLLHGAAQAQGVELNTLKLNRQDGSLSLDFVAQITLPRAVEDALQRGVPVYFVAQAEVLRPRWYWRDERIARVARSWRVAYQPLTSNWRVSLGGLNQSYASLGEALTAISRSTGWKLAELAQVEPGYLIEFSYRLDNSQLPSPMQIGLGGPTGWTLGVERVLRIE
jgi:Domain of unknown function (DUF4390)